MAVMTPKSGQVPTTTTEPAARNRRTASPRRWAEARTALSDVTSFAPIMITAASGGGPMIDMASICAASPLEVAPDIALVDKRIRLPDSSAKPRASSTPGTSSGM
ncbi:Uncharacterised protein [Mycobacteroides abscessus subsp. abscessus]|nr:Uncharacterised protein [Mycobacteroides abscessus subsp. abscessus]